MPMNRTGPDAPAPASLSMLILGNVTRDVPSQDPQGTTYELGGSVSYAAYTCHRLGVRAEVVTRAGPDVDLSDLQAKAHCTVLPAATTTTFVNRYTEAGRVQYCYRPAPPIRAADLTATQRAWPVIFMCPIMQEVAADVPACLGPQSFLAAGPQGWMRAIDESGRVHACAWHSMEAFLPHLDVLILSREDIDHDLDRLQPFLAHVPLVILSNYREGCDIIRPAPQGFHQQHVPPRPANEVDPTGAGDIFATAFLIRYLETARIWHAARFANVTASMGVEGVGMQAIPTRNEVMQYLQAHPIADPEA